MPPFQKFVTFSIILNCSDKLTQYLILYFEKCSIRRFEYDFSKGKAATVLFPPPPHTGRHSSFSHRGSAGGSRIEPSRGSAVSPDRLRCFPHADRVDGGCGERIKLDFRGNAKVHLLILFIVTSI